MKNKRNVALTIRLIDALPHDEKLAFLANIINFFLRKKQYQIILSIFRSNLNLKEVYVDDFVAVFLEGVKKIDSRKVFKQRKKDLLELWAFIKTEDPNLYVDIFYTCCLRHLINEKFSDQKEFFDTTLFDQESPRGIFDSWTQMLLLRIINVSDGYGYDEVEKYVFNPVFSRRIIIRVVPELRSAMSGLDFHEDIGKKIKLNTNTLETFNYLLRLVDFILFRRDEDHYCFSVFLSPDNEHYELMMGDYFKKRIPLIESGTAKNLIPDPIYKAAFDRIRECALYFHLANNQQFEKYIPEDLASDWGDFKNYYTNDQNSDFLYQFEWFNKMAGIIELPLNWEQVSKSKL